MEINMKINAGSLNPTTPATRSKAKAATSDAADSFASTNALDGALQSVPDVRPEAVARARELINDPSYPSAETISKLSDFFAQKLQSNVQ